MNRLDATRCLLDVAGNAPIVASLGHPSYDLSFVNDRGANFYSWGSMGLGSSMGLGLALARPDLRVFVLEGDGALLMNLGSLATIGWNRPANLVIVVLDNSQYATTGGQETATGHGADLGAAAVAMQIDRTATVRTIEELRTVLARTSEEGGPWMIVAKITESAPTQKQPLDCVFIKQRFMAAIGGAEAATSPGPI